MPLYLAKSLLYHLLSNQEEMHSPLNSLFNPLYHIPSLTMEPALLGAWEYVKPLCL